MIQLLYQVAAMQRRSWQPSFLQRREKDFQISGNVQGGVEDITDKTAGIALGVNASRVIYDGGMLDSEIIAEQYAADSAKHDYRVKLEERALLLANIWVELERYEALKKLIDSRLSVLDPLINQLEQVAKAGIGDMSRVTTAQRTVSTIRVAESDIAEGLAQARLNFVNAYGALPGQISFGAEEVSSLVPVSYSDKMIQEAPLLLSEYAAYNSGLARISALKAKDAFSVGFEARATKPFAGSEHDSTESVGLVARKTIYNGRLLESEIKEAEAIAELNAEKIRANYRDGMLRLNTAKQNIESMDAAILLARSNAELTINEIAYLRRQLVIGGSTLDSVLSAETRLYEAESKEIQYLAEKRKSQLKIVTLLGLFTPSLGL